MITKDQIDAAYRDVWSTVPHAQRLTAFARRIAADAIAGYRAEIEHNFPMSWLEQRQQWRREIARLEKLLRDAPPQSGDDQTHE